MAVGLWSACQLRLPFHGSNILAVVRSILTAQGRGSTEVLGGGALPAYRKNYSNSKFTLKKCGIEF